MRISSGQLRGKNILAPSGKLKPTSDKVRQALFNSIRTEIFGCRFLDLFAGAGSVGITALSEGASFSAFVEKDSQTYKALCINLNNLVQIDHYKTYRCDAIKIKHLFPQDCFDIVFADPFYVDSMLFLKILHNNIWQFLSKGGLFVLEHSHKEIKLTDCAALDGFTHTKKYGSSALSFFRKS